MQPVKSLSALTLSNSQRSANPKSSPQNQKNSALGDTKYVADYDFQRFKKKISLEENKL